MTGAGALAVLGLAVATIGRPAIRDLLASAAASSVRPAHVVVANQSGAALPLDPGAYPFPVTVVRSEGGASRGRNDAVAAMDPACEVLAFPNDDSTYDETVLEGVLRCFQETSAAAVACRLQDATGPRLVLPPVGTVLDRRTVWRAIEPATFVRRADFDALGGFLPHLGTGARSPWGSGEGTDLLLRLMAGGGQVHSRPDLAVGGAGERRDLDRTRFIAKHRAYARGTGYVYRLHGYPYRDRARILIGPWARPTSHAPEIGLSLRLAVARTLGRWEGLRGTGPTQPAPVGPAQTP